MSTPSLHAPFNLSDSELTHLSDRMRKSVFEVCLAAGNGHVGGSSGAVELLTVLYFGGVLRYCPHDARHPLRDRVVIRGHLGPLRYSLFSEIGYIDPAELPSYRSLGSRLHGHEDHEAMPGVDITPSGSLGMTLSYGVGAALAASYSGSSYRTFVFLGDGEEQEGNISEAARHAARLGLDNLVAVLDCNGKQLSDPIASTDSSDIPAIWRGYGWEVICVAGGHDVQELRQAYLRAIKLLEQKRPVLLVVTTTKGKGLEGAESHFSGFHTVSVCSDEVLKGGVTAIGDVAGGGPVRDEVSPQEPWSALPFRPIALSAQPAGSGGSLSIWQGKYLKWLKGPFEENADCPCFFLTADVTRKDMVDKLGLREYFAYDNLGLREQHLTAMVQGLSLSLPAARVLINTFDAFAYRSLDQLNALAIGGGSAVIIGDYAGLTNARNGATHQSTGLPAALVAIPGVTLLEPWNAVDLYNCLNWALGESRGVVYLRVHAAPVEEHIWEGQANIDFYRLVDGGDNPDLVMVASGFPVSSCLWAAQRLLDLGVKVRVVNVVGHSNLGEAFVRELVPGKPVLTVYNGSARFLQSAVASAVLRFPGNLPSLVEGVGFDRGTTGHLEELVRHYGLDGPGVLNAATALLS